MSVQFRQRKPAEYAKIAWKRKWLILLPAIAVTTAVVWVVHRLPDVYESTTLIVVKPSTLPNTVVTAITEDVLSRQLNSIATVVTSRSSLETLVEKYQLYRPERLRGVPLETIIDRVRQDIKVEVNTSRNDITNGFNITYRGREPKATQAVTAELASKYVDEQTKNTINSTAAAKQFIDQQVSQTKEALDEIDKKRLDFMQKNVGNLPSEAVALVGQLNGLREQQKAYITEVGRLQDRRSALSTNLTLLKTQTQQMREDVAKNTTDPKTTLAWSQLVTRRAQIEGELTRLKQEYREKHPDVIAKQKELDNVKEQMDQMVDEWKEKIKQEQEKLAVRPDIAAANVQNEITLVDGEIKRQQNQLGEIDKQIGAVVARINSVPGAEVALGALDRDYQTKKAAYDALLVQQQKLTLNADAASQQQGEVIQVIDAANLPETPVAPKRMMLSGIGLAFGLGFGFLLAALFEVPRLLTIQTSEDVRHYTGLPVLISVPQLLTAQEARAIPRRRRLLLAAGVAATIVSIPLLAFALKATHVFEMLMTSGRA
jgi:polysaccharide chain length determinant protein (PEP-CTERM system associated)